MKKVRLFISGLLALFIFFGCNESEKDLLEPKLYFENKKINIEVGEVDEMDYELTSRLSNMLNNDVTVEYQIGDKSYVDAYNKKYGSVFEYMETENYSMESTKAVIKAGDVFAKSCKITMKNLLQLKEGSTYIIPVVLKGEGAPLLSDANVVYLLVKKPIVINSVLDFNGNYLDVQLPISSQKTSTVTYEALIYIDNYKSLSTIMGNEGVLIFRFGDTTIGSDQIQIAGNIQFNPTMKFDKNKWYHVAFVYNAATKGAAIYVNGESVIPKEVGGVTFDLNARFCIGYAYDYDSGRTWPGKMSECRLWTVARTANQLRDNMMGVDPDSEGLLGYWKLNGTDHIERDDKHYVKDQTKNGLDALSRKGRRGETGYRPGSIVSPNYVDMKVVLD